MLISFAYNILLFLHKQTSTHLHNFPQQNKIFQKYLHFLCNSSTSVTENLHFWTKKSLIYSQLESYGGLKETYFGSDQIIFSWKQTMKEFCKFTGKRLTVFSWTDASQDVRYQVWTLLKFLSVWHNFCITLIKWDGIKTLSPLFMGEVPEL